MGAALAAKGQRPNLPWRFTVLDSPVVNAFAVPGGAIYVTRGILAMMSSANGFSKYQQGFRTVVTSFKNLTDASKINRSPQRLALVKASGRETLQAIFKRTGMPEKTWPQFAVMNGMELAATPVAGKLVKTVK